MEGTKIRLGLSRNVSGGLVLCMALYEKGFTDICLIDDEHWGMVGFRAEGERRIREGQFQVILRCHSTKWDQEFVVTPTLPLCFLDRSAKPLLALKIICDDVAMFDAMGPEGAGLDSKKGRIIDTP